MVLNINNDYVIKSVSYYHLFVHLWCFIFEFLYFPAIIFHVKKVSNSAKLSHNYSSHARVIPKVIRCSTEFKTIEVLFRTTTFLCLTLKSV